MAKRILLVDDQLSLVQLLSRLLQRHGYIVSAATDGKQALERLRLEQPDLICMDIRMPGMDGYSAMREIKKRPALKGIPVVILTSHAQMEDLFEMEGAVDYITKPFDESDFLSRIAKALGTEPAKSAELEEPTEPADQ
ncbi:MAG: response regulator [Candidatus Omnitrophica bacterium]|nr:response regulator [Candidatus Omnitrophota bacterium]